MKQLKIPIPNHFKVTEKNLQEVLNILQYSAVVLPRLKNKLMKMGDVIKSGYSSQVVNTVIAQQEIEAVHTIALFHIINSDIFKEDILCSKWFGRLTVNVLYKLKYGYTKMPIELIEIIVSEAQIIKEKYARYYHFHLTNFLIYEYGNMFYPYGTEELHLDDFYKNLHSIPISILRQSISPQKISIIIPFYVSLNEKFLFRRKIIEQNLRRILQQSYTNFKIHLVINNAGPEREWITELMTKYHLEGVMVAEENLGSARAKNECIRFLMDQENTSDYILFLDDDTYLNDNHCLLKLLHLFETVPNTFGCISPQIVHGSPWNGPILRDGYEPPWEFSVFEGFREFAEEQLQKTNQWHESFLVEGSCMMIPTDVLKKTDLFPEEYNYYHEETLMEYQIKLKQKKINAVMQNSYVTHLRIGGGSTSIHAMYYLYRNFGYLLYDAGIRQKNKAVYDLIMRQFSTYCEFLISGEELTKQAQLRERLELAKKHLREFEKHGTRIRKNEEFNADGVMFYLKNTQS